MIHHFARALAIREASTRHVKTPVPAQRAGGVRIHRDPRDGRRTVIAGRFADVCAALERMAAEPEVA